MPDERSAAPAEPSESLPDLPLVACDCCCCSSLGSSRSSLSVPLIRRLAPCGGGVDADSDDVADLSAVSVGGAEGDALPASSLDTADAFDAAFFLFCRDAAGFFFSPPVAAAAAAFFRDFGGRVSGTTMGEVLPPDVGDAGRCS